MRDLFLVYPEHPENLRPLLHKLMRAALYHAFGRAVYLSRNFTVLSPYDENA